MARVLIVEDSPTQAAQLALTLESRGFETEIARTGDDALAMLPRSSAELIVSDIVMPGLSGYELCRKVKAARPSMPVILVSSLSEPMDIIRGLECGADNFLTKPYQADHLISRINTLLRNREIRASGRFSVGIDIMFLGRKFTITSEKEQILDLLISTFEDTVRANRDLQKSRADLAIAHAKIEEYARQLEDKVRISEEKYRLLMENANDAIMILDRSGAVIEANRKLEDLLGKPKAAMVGQRYNTLLAVSDDEERPDVKLPSLLEAEHAQITDLPLRHAGGSQLWVDISASRVEVGDNSLVLLIVHDVTERRNTEMQLRQAQKMDALGRLTGGVSHDFNNLLGVIIGNLDLLVERTGDPETTELAQEALDAALRGGELTQRLLAFARRQPLTPRTIDLSTVLPGISTMLRRMLDQPIDVRTVVADGLWLTQADPSQVEGAVLNLSINARDAMPEGGCLLIEAANVRFDDDYVAENQDAVPGEYVLLSVADTGTGMPAEVIERAFEPFFTTKPPGQGTGLGLSMVYGFVKQSGGHVKIYSELGHGTTIKIYLPRAVSGDAAQLPARNDDVCPTGTENVLVVEDNASLRLVAVKVLTELGYHITEASDAQEALALLDSGAPFDLLFTDIIMPGGTMGQELAKAARERRPGLKVLLTSGYSEAFAMTRNAATLGAMIRKPYRKDELARKIRATLEDEA